MKEEILKLRDEVKAGTPEGESELLDIIRCGLADVMVDARNAIHAYVEKVTREAHDIGFRRGLRELPPDLRRPPEDAADKDLASSKKAQEKVLLTLEKGAQQ